MKRSALLMAALGVVLSAASQSQAATIVRFDENGNGNFNSGTGLQPLPGVLALDPTGRVPGNVLIYHTPLFPANTVGDVLVDEPIATAAVLTDLIFFGNDALGGYFIFYSDNSDGKDSLADSGLPTTFSANHVTINETGLEGNNSFTYVVGAFTFTGQSDSAAVPEPATLTLLGPGLAGLGFSRRKR